MHKDDVDVSVREYGSISDPPLSRTSSSIPEEASETSALLANADIPHIRAIDDEHGDGRPRTRSFRVITHLAIVAIALLSCGDQITQSPKTRILESIICYRYYEEVDASKLLLPKDRVGPGAIGGVAETDCKGDVVQSQLAMIDGYQNLFDCLPSLLLAVPFGWLADRFGRRTILLLGICSYPTKAIWIQVVTWFWRAFDVKSTWFSSAVGMFGGGSTTASGILAVVIADVTPDGCRAAAFMQIAASNLGAALVMPPISAWLMEVDPWIPCLGGTLLMLLAVSVAFLLPETLGYKRRHGHVPEPATVDPDSARVDKETNPSWPALQSVIAFAINDWRVPVVALTFVAHALKLGNTALLLQYISKRFNMTLSEATLVLTIKSVVSIISLLGLLPFLSSILVRHLGLTPIEKDLYLARASIALVATGFFLIGFAPNLAVCAVALAVGSLGAADYMLIRSFLCNLAPSHQLARVYSVVSIVDTFGMFASPMLAALFERGLGLGGVGIGLPFFFLGVLCICVTVAWCSVGVRKSEDWTSGSEDIQ